MIWQAIFCLSGFPITGSKAGIPMTRVNSRGFGSPKTDGHYTRLSYYGVIDFIFDQNATHLWITYPGDLTLSTFRNFC